MTGDLQRLLLGEGLFVDDIRLDGMLHVAFVRSPHAHARVAGIDTAETLRAPGVVAVVTADDLGPWNTMLPLRFPGLRHPQMPRPLAAGVVRFVGEPAALVLAESRYQAVDAAELVRAEYDVLPAAVSIEQARLPGTPLVHDEAAMNLAGSDRWTVGDPDAAFAHAPVRLSFTLDINRGAAVPIETRGCLASHDPVTGILTLWASTQNPHYLRRVISAVLGLEIERVRVVAPDVGGAFGVKGGAPREYLLVARMALQTGRPVKWIEDRREHFLACQQDRDQLHRIEIAATREGELVAIRDGFSIDLGAYSLYGQLIGLHTIQHMVGPYHVPHLDFQFEAVYTHTAPTGAYRGAGRPQGTFVIERVMDRLARELEIDPAAVRRRNLIQPDAMPHDTGLRQPDGRPVQYDSGDYPRLLEVALERFGYVEWRSEQRRRAGTTSLLGVGVALFVQETAADGRETVTLRMEPSGRVVMSAGPASQGQGLGPILTRMIARELSVPVNFVRVASGDTAAMSESFGTHGSRVATVIGNAAASAARQLAAQLRGLAAEMIACDAGEIELADGHAVRRGGAGGSIPYGNLVQHSTSGDAPAALNGHLEVSATFEPGGSAWSSGAHLVALEIDRDTGDVNILKYLIVHDSGMVLDEEGVRRQILGGVLQGIGGSLYERVLFTDSGQPLAAAFSDYAVPRAAQAPPVEIVRLETPSPHNPLGLKGAGESGCMGAYAVIASAVEDALAATGYRVASLPIVATQIWEVVRGPDQPGGR